MRLIRQKATGLRSLRGTSAALPQPHLHATRRAADSTGLTGWHALGATAAPVSRHRRRQHQVRPVAAGIGAVLGRAGGWGVAPRGGEHRRHPQLGPPLLRQAHALRRRFAADTPAAAAQDPAGVVSEGVHEPGGARRPPGRHHGQGRQRTAAGEWTSREGGAAVKNRTAKGEDWMIRLEG